MTSTNPGSPPREVPKAEKRTYRRRQRLGSVTTAEVSDILTLKAQGLSDRSVGRAVGINSGTVGDIARRPENQAEILARRAWLKSRTAQRLEALIDPAWDMAHEAALQKDAKGFDFAMRGLHAQEKISASISGENQRVSVEHSGKVDVDREPVIVQLQQLIAMVKADAPGTPKPLR